MVLSDLAYLCSKSAVFETYFALVILIKNCWVELKVQATKNVVLQVGDSTIEWAIYDRLLTVAVLRHCKQVFN